MMTSLHLSLSLSLSPLWTYTRIHYGGIMCAVTIQAFSIKFNWSTTVWTWCQGVCLFEDTLLHQQMVNIYSCDKVHLQTYMCCFRSGVKEKYCTAHVTFTIVDNCHTNCLFLSSSVDEGENTLQQTMFSVWKTYPWLLKLVICCAIIITHVDMKSTAAYINRSKFD